VLDPFCGCGTSINVAERLKRRWIGIDITHLAVALMRYRLNDTFGPELSPYEVLGAPEDLAGAKALAELDATNLSGGRWGWSMQGQRKIRKKAQMLALMVIFTSLTMKAESRKRL